MHVYIKTKHFGLLGKQEMKVGVYECISTKSVGKFGFEASIYIMLANNNFYNVSF
jgi:hypothetical protein